MTFASAGTVSAPPTPRIYCAPPEAAAADPSESAHVALEICALAGLWLKPWQQSLLVDSLAERADGKWAAFEIGEVVARQNGKGAVLEARELTGAFGIDEERLIIHSAHEQATSTEHQRRILNLIEGVPEFDQKVMKIRRGKGEEAIELRDGTRILFKTRTGGGGRGFTGDLVVLDEAMFITAAFMAALVPTMAARSMNGNPQMWYAGTAVDQAKHEHGVELARVRQRAIQGSLRLLYAEYSAHVGDPLEDDPAKVPDEVRLDPRSWAQANPSLGELISEEYVADEERALGSREFCVERLGIGSWPDPDEGYAVIPAETWAALLDPEGLIHAGLAFAVDTTPERSFSAMSAAGYREDGLFEVEVGEHRPGTEWVVPRAKELTEKHGTVVFVVDGRGPAASLITPLEQAGVAVVTASSTDMARACGLFYDTATQNGLRHRGTPELRAAVKGAVKRSLGDAWAWSRKNSGVDISPLVACTLALWGCAEAGALTGGFEWH